MTDLDPLFDRLLATLAATDNSASQLQTAHDAFFREHPEATSFRKQIWRRFESIPLTEGELTEGSGSARYRFGDATESGAAHMRDAVKRAALNEQSVQDLADRALLKIDDAINRGEAPIDAFSDVMVNIYEDKVDRIREYLFDSDFIGPKPIKDSLGRLVVSQIENITPLGYEKVKELRPAATATEELAPQQKPVVFIAHGGKSKDWLELKNYLRDQGISVVDYESVATAGKITKDRVMEMVDKCNIAFVVMSAEDEQAAGDEIRPRQNVIHELGLFQGRHGWERAIPVTENGVGLFSNIAGLGEIRFAPGDISGCFHKVLDVLRREFPSTNN